MLICVLHLEAQAAFMLYKTSIKKPNPASYFA